MPHKFHLYLIIIIYLQRVNGVTDVDVFDLLVKDEAEAARFFSVLFRQKKRVTFWRQGGHLFVCAETQALG